VSRAVCSTVEQPARLDDLADLVGALGDEDGAAEGTQECGGLRARRKQHERAPDFSASAASDAVPAPVTPIATTTRDESTFTAFRAWPSPVKIATSRSGEVFAAGGRQHADHEAARDPASRRGSRRASHPRRARR
jgi:hypothetical protein